MSVDVVTFGCRLNTYESEVIRNAAATAAAHAAEPQALVSPAPRSQVRTTMWSSDFTAQSEMLARSGKIG